MQFSSLLLPCSCWVLLNMTKYCCFKNESVNETGCFRSWGCIILLEENIDHELNIFFSTKMPLKCVVSCRRLWWNCFFPIQTIFFMDNIIEGSRFNHFLVYYGNHIGSNSSGGGIISYTYPPQSLQWTSEVTILIVF